MSDTWYKTPMDLPPWQYGDQAWTFDGEPANDAARRSIFRPDPSVTFEDLLIRTVEAMIKTLIMGAHEEEEGTRR